MYLRIYWGRVRPASWDAVARRYQTLMGIQCDGLLGRFVTRDINDPQSLFTVTIWDTLENLQNWERSDEYRQVFLGPLEAYLEGSHSVSLCEVELAQIGDLAALIPPVARTEDNKIPPD